MEDATLQAPTFSGSVEEYGARLALLASHRKASLYDCLELDSSCATSDVRRAYYHFAKILHPDKCGDPAATAYFNEIQCSYDVLADDYKRMLYDLKHGFRNDEQYHTQLAAISDALKERYRNFLQDRSKAYVASVLYEYNRRGLVIKKALYGDLSLRDPTRLTAKETIAAHHLKGPFIDVTVQLQVLIEHGVLHVNAGGPLSYAFLPGFYNPMDFVSSKHGPGYEDETQLYILYLFKVGRTAAGKHTPVGRRARGHDMRRHTL
ncbi:DnaJ domain-containing protein [Babesia caballi]|uniref:DnaJ domain-containing protein n=1 Tax=Babesia caballi TaxID=5871 RepID=A0AAV4LTS1_BABCB|nr:DnaJ domain-containing protein [Babesia caballi]